MNTSEDPRQNRAYSLLQSSREPFISHRIESDNESEMDVQTLVPPPLLYDNPQKSKEDQRMEALVWWIVAFCHFFKHIISFLKELCPGYFISCVFY